MYCDDNLIKMLRFILMFSINIMVASDTDLAGYPDAGYSVFGRIILI